MVLGQIRNSFSKIKLNIQRGYNAKNIGRPGIRDMDLILNEAVTRAYQMKKIRYNTMKAKKLQICYAKRKKAFE
jgi:hypothetical protein